MSDSSVRLVTFYLPQYHPIPENDEWWGAGFTEWRNVVQGKPLFRGHYQPHLPGELGYYDLRVAETRAGQAALAREYGISGFSYYHYWSMGRQLLEQPFDRVLQSGEPNFPFCLCWANESWTRAWDGRTGVVLRQQEYSAEDDRAHLEWLAPALCDPRYLRVEGKPLFLVYRAGLLPEPQRTTDIWRERARQLGIGELFLARVESFPEEQTDPRPLGFDAAVEFQPDWHLLGEPMRRRRRWRWATRAGLSEAVYQTERVYNYATVAETMMQKPAPDYLRFPCVMPMWDNSARRKHKLVMFKDSTPELYERWLASAVARTRAFPPEKRLVFVNAWNEWGEGNHLEPDRKHGRAYLEATRRALEAASSVGS